MKKLKLFMLLFLTAQTAFVSGQPVIGRIFLREPNVGLYEKLEIPLQIDAVYENPYDPDEIDVMASFTAPSGKKWEVPGFYNQVYRGGFFLRFSADETGTWSYSVRVRDKNGTAESGKATFTVRPSEHHGPSGMLTVPPGMGWDSGTTARIQRCWMKWRGVE
jgi:hypothetical protein